MPNLLRYKVGLAATAVAVGSVVALPTSVDALAPSTSEDDKILGKNQDKLKLVQVVFRHGARTPLSKKYWPKLVDSWDVCGESYSPVPVVVMAENGDPRPINRHNEQQIATKFDGGCHKGELTRLGQIQARELGDWLRRRYISRLRFMPTEYDPRILYCRTTNYSRTISTLQGVLTGLYPELKEPVPVLTTEEMDEILFGNAEACERLTALIKEMAIKAKTDPVTRDLEILQNQIRDALDLGPTDRIDFLDLHDAVTTMLTHNKPLPERMRNPGILKKIEEHAAKRFSMFVVGLNPRDDQQVLRLGMGRLLYLMLLRMREAGSKSSNEPRMFLYSGHDSTIMPLLGALGVQTDDHWPSYASNLVFELWERAKDGEHYVKVLYNREDLSLSELCGKSRCSLDALQNRVLKPLMMRDDERERECLLHFSHDRPAGQHVKETITVGSSISNDGDD